MLQIHEINFFFLCLVTVSLAEANQKFLNPFDSQTFGNEQATADDVKKFAIEYRKIASQFVTSIHGSQQVLVEQAKQMSSVTTQLLTGVTGLSKKNPELGKQLKDEGTTRNKLQMQFQTKHLLENKNLIIIRI